MVSDSDKFNQRTRHGKWMNPIGQADLASIIIPTYNRAELLDETLASAAQQTYRPLEIIVVDDGSTDDTRAVVDRWREKLKSDSRAAIRYFHQDNSGVGSARNHGLIESRGEFIQFLDSDDILNSEKLSLHIACLRRHPQCGYVFSGRTKTDNPNKWGKISLDEATVLDSAELYCSPRVMMTMVGVYRRGTCCQAGPYSEDMRLGEDEEFNLRAILSTERSVYLPGILCAIRNHGGPRLTDALWGRSGLVLWADMYRRMVENAGLDGRLNNRRLVKTLGRRLDEFIVDVFAAGCRDLAGDAIKIGRRLPIGRGRRIKLACYQGFILLPGGIFSRYRRLRQKVQRGVGRLRGWSEALANGRQSSDPAPGKPGR